MNGGNNNANAYASLRLRSPICRPQLGLRATYVTCRTPAFIAGKSATKFAPNVYRNSKATKDGTSSYWLRPPEGWPEPAQLGLRAPCEYGLR